MKDFDEISQASSAAATEILDEEGKPFWMKFFKKDYLGESAEPRAIKAAQILKGQQPPPQGKALTKEALEKQERMRKEYEKIMKLDAELAQKTKINRELKNARLVKEQLLREKLEEEER